MQIIHTNTKTTKKPAAMGMAPLEAEETATHNLVVKRTMTKNNVCNSQYNTGCWV